MNRWWIYQRERFPLIMWAAFITAVALGVLAVSAGSRGAGGPSWQSFAVAFVCSVLVFFQLRVADEFKDFEDDAVARPYRPVQRGLVRLSELRVIAVVALAVQVTAAALLDVRLLLALGVVLAYLALMTREFFVPRWLRHHATAYLLSHQLILPMIYFFIAACDWLPANAASPRGLGWILAMAYASGTVVEIGRKIRSDEDEETGVQTYSVLWGRRRAVVAWLFAVLASGVTAASAAATIGFGRVVTSVAAVMFITLVVIGVRFLSRPQPGAGRRIDTASGIWTIAIHGALAASLFR